MHSNEHYTASIEIIEFSLDTEDSIGFNVRESSDSRLIVCELGSIGEKLGVQIGDTIAKINYIPFGAYTWTRREFMALIRALPRPLVIHFWRVKHDEQYEQWQAVFEAQSGTSGMKISILENGTLEVSQVSEKGIEKGIANNDWIIGVNYIPVNGYSSKEHFMTAVNSKTQPMVLNILRQSSNPNPSIQLSPEEQTDDWKYRRKSTIVDAMMSENGDNSAYKNQTISAASSLFPIHEDVYHSLQNSVEKRVVTAMIFEDLKKFTELQKLALSIRAAQARPVVKEELYTDDVAQLQAILAQEKQKRKVIEEVYANLFESIEEHTEEK